MSDEIREKTMFEFYDVADIEYHQRAHTRDEEFRVLEQIADRAQPDRGRPRRRAPRVWARPIVTPVMGR